MANLNRGEYRQAIQYFTEALRNGSSAQVDTYFHRGVAYLEKGDPETARDDFNEVIKQRPDFADAYVQRARASVLLGQFYDTPRDCTQAIRLQPDNALAYRYRGEAHLQRRKYGRSVADFNEAIHLKPELAGEVNPQLGEAYYHLSQELKKRNDIARADEALKKAIELNPQYVEILEIEKPVRTFGPDGQQKVNKIVDASGRDIDAVAYEHYARGLAHLERSEYEPARDAFSMTIEIEPTYGDAYVRRGIAFLKGGFPDTALKDFEQATYSGKQSAEIYCLRAEACARLGRHRSAAFYATEAIQRDHRHAKAYQVRGAAYFRAGNLDRAIVDLEQVLKLDQSLAEDVKPTLGKVYYRRSLARDKAGLADKAWEDLKRAAELGDPDARREKERREQERSLESRGTVVTRR